MTPVIIVRLLQTTFSDILWPLEIKQTDRCHRDREEELDRQADRTDGGLVSNTVWFGDQPTRGKLSNTGRKLLINLSSDGEKPPERAEREWERENEGQERKRGIQQNMTRCEKGEWQRANYPLLCSRYFFLMIFIELIQWCRSSNTPANTVDWIEIELSRTTEEQIESGILKDKAAGIERQWWKEDGCKKMERCETKKGQSIWRKFDAENVRMSWKVWDMTGRKEVWCSLKQVCASLWHIVNHQATLILTKQQLKKEDKKRKKMICTPRSCHPHWIWVENWMCDR